MHGASIANTRITHQNKSASAGRLQDFGIKSAPAGTSALISYQHHHIILLATRTIGKHEHLGAKYVALFSALTLRKLMDDATQDEYIVGKEETS